MWSSDTNHVLITKLNYHLGKPHGEQRKWYLTGELHKKLNLNMGREEGIQQAFRRNGALYANYEAKNGRIFGLKKSIALLWIRRWKTSNIKNRITLLLAIIGLKDILIKYCSTYG